MTCFVFSAAKPGPAGPCAVCGEHYGQAHYVQERQALYGACCCPVHRQASLDWEREEVETVKGTQEVMF